MIGCWRLDIGCWILFSWNSRMRIPS